MKASMLESCPDFSKSLDSLNHRPPPVQPEPFGIRGQANQVVEPFLTRGTYTFRIDNKGNTVPSPHKWPGLGPKILPLPGQGGQGGRLYGKGGPQQQYRDCPELSCQVLLASKWKEQIAGTSTHGRFHIIR